MWTKWLLALRSAGALVLALAAASFWTSGRAVAETTLDFEDLPPGTTVTTQFGPRGVVFPFGAFIDADPAARSGTRVLRSGDPSDEFHQGPLVMTFNGGQRVVRFFAGAQFSGQSGTLRALDAAGSVIATDGPRAVAVKSFTTRFEVAVAGPAIRRVELELTNFAFESIDDLSFDGDPPTVPTEPPAVSIEAPQNGAELDVATLIVQGTIKGPGLLSTARLTIAQGLPPDSTAPPFQTTLALAGTGETRTFTESFTTFLGPLTIEVRGENSGGQTGSQTIAAVNLPDSIRQRHSTEGGTSTFGALRYSARTTCTVAVYERGAVFSQNTTTRVIRGDIFLKWLAERDARAPFSRLGCPLGERRDAGGGSLAQDFERGRIYSGLSTGTHFVPGVFRDALDVLGGEAATGVPIADPTSSPGVMRTWLFQRFMRSEHPDLQPSTLEIRGTPPTLWVQRQASDGTDNVFFDIPITDASPTLWLRFPCAGNLGPCQVAAPSSGVPIFDAGERFCRGTTYPLPPPPIGPKEWAPVVGDHVITRLAGIVKNSGLASKDNPITHSCVAAGALDLFPSDLNVTVRPLHPHRHLFADNRVNMEIEFEYCWFHFGFAAGMEPRRGDLVLAGGRWIIDCGHRPFRSEIHPPAVMASMRTVTLDNRPATKADIWINGTYTGDRFDVEIFPPPRPSPNALLTLQKPLDAASAVGINVEADIVDLMVGRARFSASPRKVPVSVHGEMQLQQGRVYHGRWHVFWSEP
jgi:hypothetical protein